MSEGTLMVGGWVVAWIILGYFIHKIQKGKRKSWVFTIGGSFVGSLIVLIVAVKFLGVESAEDRKLREAIESFRFGQTNALSVKEVLKKEHPDLSDEKVSKLWKFENDRVVWATWIGDASAQPAKWSFIRSWEPESESAKHYFEAATGAKFLSGSFKVDSPDQWFENINESLKKLGLAPGKKREPFPTISGDKRAYGVEWYLPGFTAPGVPGTYPEIAIELQEHGSALQFMDYLLFTVSKPELYAKEFRAIVIATLAASSEAGDWEKVGDLLIAGVAPVLPEQWGGKRKCESGTKCESKADVSVSPYSWWPSVTASYDDGNGVWLKIGR